MQTLFQGKIVEVVQDGKREFARRSPGTRLIIVNLEKKQILLTEEYREELKKWDTRLPGGKVFDTLIEYNQYLSEGKDVVAAAELGAKKEAEEETGIRVDNIQHFHTSVCGATVVWDLLYFVVDKFTVLPGQKLEEGEQIRVKWVSFDEARQLCLSGKLSEDRSVAVLLRYLAIHG